MAKRKVSLVDKLKMANYVNTNVILTNVERYISKRENTKTGVIRFRIQYKYFDKESQKNKITTKTFKTIEEAREFRDSNIKLGGKESKEYVEPNIYKTTSSRSPVSYIVMFNLNHKRYSARAKTLAEARRIKKNKIPEKQITKKNAWTIEYTKKYIKRTTVEENISRHYNTKTDYTKYVFRIHLYDRDINKTFKTLEEAQWFKKQIKDKINEIENYKSAA